MTFILVEETQLPMATRANQSHPGPRLQPSLPQAQQFASSRGRHPRFVYKHFLASPGIPGLVSPQELRQGGPSVLCPSVYVMACLWGRDFGAPPTLQIEKRAGERPHVCCHLACRAVILRHVWRVFTADS